MGRPADCRGYRGDPHARDRGTCHGAGLRLAARFGGAFEIAYAIHTRAQGFGWKLVSALLTLVLGIAIVIWPVAGIASLGFLVGAFFFSA